MKGYVCHNLRMMRWFWVVCLSALPVLAQDDMTRARRIQSEVIGIDTHIDTAQRLLFENADISKRLQDGHVDLPRLREGGMYAPFFSLWVPVYYHGAEAVRRTLDLRDATQSFLDAHPDQFVLATGESYIERFVC